MAGDIRRFWLRHWHSVIDDFVGQDPAFDFEASYKDPYADFRMHFVTWDLPDESLRRCFEVLPRGAEICCRAIEMRVLYRANRSTIPEQEALDLFQRGLDGFVQFVENEVLKRPVRIAAESGLYPSRLWERTTLCGPGRSEALRTTNPSNVRDDIVSQSRCRVVMCAKTEH